MTYPYMNGPECADDLLCERLTRILLTKTEFKTEFDGGLVNVKRELRELTLAFQEVILYLKKKEEFEAAAAYQMRKSHRDPAQAALLIHRGREYKEIHAQKQAEFAKSRSTAPALKNPGRYREQFEG